MKCETQLPQLSTHTGAAWKKPNHLMAQREENNNKGNGFQQTPISRAVMLSPAEHLCLARRPPRLAFLASPRSAPWVAKPRNSGAMPLGMMLSGAMHSEAMPLGMMHSGAMPLGMMPSGAMPSGSAPGQRCLFRSRARSCLSLLPSASRGAPVLAGSSFTLSRGNKSRKTHFLQH